MTSTGTLRAGSLLEIEGVAVRALGRSIEVGDLYVAERNTGPHLLTAAEIHPRQWVRPREPAYSYDTWECVPVEMVDV